MLQNAYLIAKIGADTAENERKFAENLPKMIEVRRGGGEQELHAVLLAVAASR